MEIINKNNICIRLEKMNSRERCKLKNYRVKLRLCSFYFLR